MDMTSTHLTADQVVERNLRVVDEHFHNENPVDIDKAIALYAPEIVWELPARGVLYRDKEQVKQAYLKMFQSYGLQSITFVRRQAASNWVIDDAIADLTLVGDVEHNVPNCPLPSGTKVSLRVVHYFELDDEGRITRENAYELWRRADAALNDDIPADAVTVHLS
jgi:ketosteroid isomerase-like protein